MKRRSLARIAAAASAIATLTLLAPLAASAHVTVAPNQATPGSYVKLTFSVPTESATAGTTQVAVSLPTAHPFTSVSYQAVPGWTATVVTEKLAKPVKTDDGTVTTAPTSITWAARPGTEIAPGQFQQFTISAGMVPDTGMLLLPVRQTYSDGTVVDWDQATPSTGVEPEHPAPTLYINEQPPAGDGGVAGNGAGAGTPAVTATPVPTGADAADDSVAIGLGLAGLALGAIALVISVYALTRRSRAAGREK